MEWCAKKAANFPVYYPTACAATSMRSTARPGGVRLMERIDALGDGLVTPLQAQAMGALRRALALNEQEGARACR